MIDQRMAELISAALDDALDNTERSELDRLRAESAEARAYHDAMTRLDTHRANLPEKEVPYELHGQIMRSMPVKASSPGGLFASSFWSGVLRYGLAGLAGVLFAVGIYESKPGDASEVAGTMAPKAIVLDGFEFDADGLSSAVDLKRRGDRYTLDVAVDADAETALVITFSRDAYRFGALEQLENEFEFCEFADGIIRAGVHGNHRFAVALAPREDAASTDAAITLEYSGDGRLVQKTLVPSR